MPTNKPRKRRRHLVTIGNVGFDHPHTPRGKRKVVGGAAYFASKAASLFSKRVGIVTRVGKDFDLGFLRKLGIEMSGVRVIKTGKTFRWYSKYDQDFNVVKSRGELNVGDRVIPSDIPEHFLDAKHIHVASMHPRVQKRIIDYLRRRGCRAKISVDTIEKFIKEYPQQVKGVILRADIIFLNEREYDRLKALDSMERQMVIRKRGKKGAEVHHKGEVTRVRAPKVKMVVDTTGAGDMLAGAFLTLLARGHKPQEALKEAVRIASKSVEQFGVEHL